MANLELYWELSIRLPMQEYPILIGHNLLEEKLIRRYVESQQVLVVTNETIAPFFSHFLQEAFKDRQCDLVILPDGEIHKNQQSLTAIYDSLVRNRHHRDTTLIALGGGVIGDITGFAAATFQRGVRFLQIPTSLLAQVDASVGGKTAINHLQAKNMLGCFHQPSAVIIDLLTLKTLPLREFRSALAEIIKYALLTGGEFFAQVYGALQEGLAENSSSELPEIISNCCQIKAKFVNEDEKEQGMRALLNLGHTFAHAIEAYGNFQRWLHGEAVAMGLYCAALFSFQLGKLDKPIFSLIQEMLALAKLPYKLPGDINPHYLQDLIMQDKKIKNGRLRLILIKSIGACYIEEQVTERALAVLLQEAME